MIALFFTKHGPGVKHLPDKAPPVYRMPVLDRVPTVLPSDSVLASMRYHERIFRRVVYALPVDGYEDWLPWASGPSQTGGGLRYITVPVYEEAT